MCPCARVWRGGGHPRPTAAIARQGKLRRQAAAGDLLVRDACLGWHIPAQSMCAGLDRRPTPCPAGSGGAAETQQRGTWQLPIFALVVWPTRRVVGLIFGGGQKQLQ